jgi:hypothetical protein
VRTNDEGVSLGGEGWPEKHCQTLVSQPLWIAREDRDFLWSSILQMLFVYEANPSSRVFISLTIVLNLLLKLSFLTIDVFMPNHLCIFKSSDAG